jgi:hypothetical protein
MKNLLKIEEALMLALAIFLNSRLPYPGWYFWAWFLAPDVGFIGYSINTRVGAFTYNVLHHKGVAILCYLAGLYFSSFPLQLAGLVLFGHSSFDRILGYGLKYPDSFQNTHLGPIGRRMG